MVLGAHNRTWLLPAVCCCEGGVNNQVLVPAQLCHVYVHQDRDFFGRPGGAICRQVGSFCCWSAPSTDVAWIEAAVALHHVELLLKTDLHVALQASFARQLTLPYTWGRAPSNRRVITSCAFNLLRRVVCSGSVLPLLYWLAFKRQRVQHRTAVALVVRITHLLAAMSALSTDWDVGVHAPPLVLFKVPTESHLRHEAVAGSCFRSCSLSFSGAQQPLPPRGPSVQDTQGGMPHSRQSACGSMHAMPRHAMRPTLSAVVLPPADAGTRAGFRELVHCSGTAGGAAWAHTANLPVQTAPLRHGVPMHRSRTQLCRGMLQGGDPLPC